jgi:hypothetical protein
VTDADGRRQRGDSEEPGGERPPDACEAVHRDRADWVVDAETLDERHRDDRDRRRDEADQDRGPRGNEPARGRDRHERREDAVQHHRDVRLAQNEPRDADPAHAAGRSREVRGQRDVAEEADVSASRNAKG